MILEKNKLQSLSDADRKGKRYIINEETGQAVYFEYYLDNDNDEALLVSITDEDGVMFNEEKSKNFAGTSDGFQDATKYFEQLIAENDPDKKEESQQTQKPNPIGLLCKTKNPRIWTLTMQDGRRQSCIIGDDELVIYNNILMFGKNYAPELGRVFTSNESYYIDIIKGNEDCYALYPKGDLDQQGDDNIDQPINADNPSDLPDPKNQPKNTPKPDKGDDGKGDDGKGDDGKGDDGKPKNGEPPGQGGEDGGDKGGEDGGDGGKPKGGEPPGQGGEDKQPKDGKQQEKNMQEKLANYFSFSNFKDLIDYYTSEDELFTEINTYSKNELKSMMKGIGLPENTSIDQLKQKVG